MSQLISLTSGSKSILTKIMAKYPEHHLAMYKSLTENNFQLIDWFTNKSIFKLPISYRIIQSSKLIREAPFINLIFLTLSPKQKKLLFAYVKYQLLHSMPNDMTSLFELQNIDNSSKMIIGTSWTANTKYLSWVIHSFVQKFLEDPNNDCFHNNLERIR
ncbi:hypothetical protein [Acetilactobacillus jinshanensis]|uniref:Uncharacterized protein n=1 Tax=Acetilactobacillus jinshanensis TaxID=1720083 RepID=A0A4P6ZK12_9LACO|nr:hypothetical protein [Acetilactobacillus jinshanensis]QBP17883.1 hypothetical protein ELX58_01670 [Acetilactobacillus jinshanensis]URL60745.1 hypothetical protein HGK75_01700 [uncultured bacterium]